MEKSDETSKNSEPNYNISKTSFIGATNNLISTSDESIDHLAHPEAVSFLGNDEKPRKSSEASTRRRISTYNIDKWIWRKNSKFTDSEDSSRRESNHVKPLVNEAIPEDEDVGFMSAFTRKRSKTSTLECFSNNESSQKPRFSVETVGITSLFSRKRSSTNSGEQAQKGSDRKRSSGATAQTFGVTYPLQNLSIFKPDPLNVLPDSVTIFSQEPGESFLETANQDVSTSKPDEETDNAAANTLNSRQQRVGHIKSFTVGNVTGMQTRDLDRRLRYPTSADSQWNNRRFALTSRPVEKSQEKHSRGMSIANFITSPFNGNIKRVTPNKLSDIRIPIKWLSLRNVISFFNIIIITFAILIVSLVSYFAGVDSTRSAIAAMSNVTINDVTLKLDQTLSVAETMNMFSQSIFTTPIYPISNSARAMYHLYFVMTQTDVIDQIYVASTDGNFGGCGLERINGTVTPSKLLIKYSTIETNFRRLVYRVDDFCAQNNTSCRNQAFPNPKYGRGPLVDNSSYVPTSRPFYQFAMATGRVGWSPIYQYARSTVFGITAVRPVWSLGTLQFVCAIDISLDMLSSYLTSVSDLIRGDNNEEPLLFVFESATGLMVASSRLDVAPVTDSSTGARIMASDSGSSEVSNSVQEIVDAYGSLAGLVWPTSGSPLVFQSSNSHIIVGHYTRSFGDLDWIVVAYIPYSTFNGSISRAYFFQVPLAAILVLCISTFSSFLITRALGRPLKTIAKQMLQIADLNFDQDELDDDTEEQETNGQLPFTGKKSARKTSFINLKEVVYLKSAMSSMKSGLISFSKYVPLDVVTLLIKMKREAVLGVDEMEVSVLFSDIVNFTTLAECLTPKQLVDLMSMYLSEMSDIIQQSHGVVDKYIGDAIMAFWNAPIQVKDHAIVSCAVALKCQQRLAELRIEWSKKGYPDIYARIGINTGPVLVGNLGSSTRLSYTCLGDNVNLASRLEGLNKKYKSMIMISEFTFEKICSSDYFLTRSLDVVTVKGKTKPVRVYELLGFRKSFTSEKVSAYTLYERSFEEYLAGNFQAAMAGFQTYLRLPDMDPEDYVANMQLDKCLALLETPPDSSEPWSPVVHLEEK